MTNFLPNHFDCSDAIRQTIEQKLAALSAIADELPVYIIHDVRNFSVVYLSPNGLTLLGATLDEVREMGPAYFARFFDPEEVSFSLPAFTETLRQPGGGEWFSHFQQVRTGKGQTFQWYLSAARLFACDDNGQPLLSLTFALPLDPNHHLAEKAERLTAENLMLKESYHRFASLTKREKELLKYIAAGETATETSNRLFISEKTLNTHRRNIKQKLGAKSQYDLIKFAQAFNLV